MHNNHHLYNQKKSFLYYAFYVLVVFLFGMIFVFFFNKGVSVVQAKINNTVETNVEDNNEVPIEDSHFIPLSNIFSVDQSPVISVPEKIETIEKNKKTSGFFMFRGSPERNFYGVGPVPKDPEVIWQYPKKAMCSLSISLGVTKNWCGAGWTGQPILWEHDNKTEIIFGGYDGAFHFVNADTGEDMRKPFQTGDIIKGSATLDPDGYPLLYGGSRDNIFRIFSLQDKEAKEIWKLDSATLGGIWNNDWDSNPVIIDDILYEGCENGIFYIFKLNRTYDVNGNVSVDPVMLFSYKTYNDDLIKKVGNNLSIENSTLVVGDRAYIANSGGRILGFDISNVESGSVPVVFDYWVGDDTDATLIADDAGNIYVTAELERYNDRALSLGQFIKLDPKKADPYVWGIKIDQGAWATPAISGNYIYLPTHSGKLLTIEKNTGGITDTKDVGLHAWSSPNVVDGELIVAICEKPELRSYSLSDPAHPALLWSKKVAGGCIESTPTIWKNNIYFSSRDGYFYKVSSKNI